MVTHGTVQRFSVSRRISMRPAPLQKRNRTSGRSCAKSRGSYLTKMRLVWSGNPDVPTTIFNDWQLLLPPRRQRTTCVQTFLTHRPRERHRYDAERNPIGYAAER